MDVGHQAYPHKIITGHRDRIKTLRQTGELSGFTRAESEFDPFGVRIPTLFLRVRHGLARDLKSEKNHVIAVIGDGL